MQQFQFAVILAKEVEDILLLHIQKALEESSFSNSVVKFGYDRILLLYMSDKTKIYQALEELHIELPKYKSNKMRQSKKRMEKYEQFIRIRDLLAPEIREMEQYGRFKVRSMDKFVSESGILDVENDLIEIAIYHLLAKIPVTPEVVNYAGAKQSEIPFLLIYLKSLNLVTDICPLRTFRHSTYTELKKAYDSGVRFLDQIVSQTKKQLGEQVAWYFAFLLYLIKHMLIVVVLGFVTYFLDEAFGFDVVTSPFEPLYAALVVLWGGYFVAKWEKRQLQQAILWRSHGENFEIFEKTLEKSLIKCLSHEDHFEIEKKVQQIEYLSELDPVTGLRVQLKRGVFKIYLRSIIKTAPYILALIAFLVISLNARGYIHPDGFLHMQYLQQWAKPGEVFDPNGWGSLTLTVIHVLVVFGLNLKYKEVSIATSLEEGHESLHSFETSLIIKRFAFEIFSAFLDFFYIGFILRDIERLKSEMVSMFAVDEIRRILTETVIPSLQKMRLQKQIHQTVDLIGKESIEGMCKKIDQSPEELRRHLKSQLISIYLPKYESFDDYLEIILNFGYLCFFTSAYRMSGIVITFFLLLEFLSDYYKVYHLYQKPISVKAKSIGPWSDSMWAICVVSVFTNLLLFSLASDQIVEYFPWLFVDSHALPNHGKLLMATPAKGKGSQMVLIIFVIEHVLLLLLYGLKVYVRSKRTWSDIYMDRLTYKQKIQ